VDTFIKNFHQLAKLKLTLIEYEESPFTLHVSLLKEMIEASCQEMMRESQSLNESLPQVVPINIPKPKKDKSKFKKRLM
jgi:hypothetical protein